jgi:hypothetical protein
MSMAIQDRLNCGPLLETRQWLDQALRCFVYHWGMEASHGSNKVCHLDRKASHWHKMFPRPSSLDPRRNPVHASHQNCRAAGDHNSIPLHRNHVKILSFQRAYRTTSFSQQNKKHYQEKSPAQNPTLQTSTELSSKETLSPPLPLSL